MIKIWAKTYRDKKIIQNEVIRIDGRYDGERFDEYLRLVCHELDIPTPVIVSSNSSNFERFNIARWRSSDFIEFVDFDEFTIENCPVD